MGWRRPWSVTASAGGVIVSVVVLAGCAGSGPVQVHAPAVTGAAGDQCANLIAALPERVGGQERRDVSPSGATAAAWGEPAIVLRCGVDKPAALRRTSQCLEVNHVFWLATEDGRPVDLAAQVDKTLTFTTIGRSVNVELSVPGDYQPPADALVDVAGAISGATESLHPCL